MAMSFCSNWDTFQHLSPEMNTYQQIQVELTREHFGFCDNAVSPPNSFTDPFFDSNDNFLYSENYTNLLPYYSSSSNDPPLVSLTPEILPFDNFDCYGQYPKRQKCYNDLYYSNFTPNFYDEYLPNSCPVPELLPELMFPVPEIQIPPSVVYSGGSGDAVESTTKKSIGRCLSAQSIAARQRRRRITEKTQELGKLIPGGNKMNTAEMLQAAHNYLKYLQAQVGILEFMGSIQESEAPAGHVEEELKVLLASSTIQEKLYSEEKCLVPKKFVETLSRDHGIQSNPSIFKAIDLLIQSDG